MAMKTYIIVIANDIYNALIVVDEYAKIDNEPVNVYTIRNINTNTIPNIPIAQNILFHLFIFDHESLPAKYTILLIKRIIIDIAKHVIIIVDVMLNFLCDISRFNELFSFLLQYIFR